MRICLDLDGVVCHVRDVGQSYADVEPIPGAIEAIRRLRAEGHVVILHTARHMQTCGGNVGAVIARQGKVTLDWLERHGVELDEIHFGKPIADVYIDDNGHRFTSWCDPSLDEVGIAPLDPDLLDALAPIRGRAA
jgi:capsule biosynthesis phosphatase